MYKNINTWNELKKRIEIIGEPSPENRKNNNKPWQLDDFILPRDYIDFFDVFGEGFLGQSIRIRLPDTHRSSTSIGCFKAALIGVYHDNELSQTFDLMDRSFVFADTDRSELFIWDLRSYSVEDDSYDIYWIGIGSVDFYLVGRSFFEFINDFCYGLKSFQITPEYKHFDPSELTLTFTYFEAIEGVLYLP
jgi:hypothetical protein